MTASASSSASTVERQQMSVDIAGVGFGPAMGGFLTTLSRKLLNDDGTPRFESAASPGLPLQVICYERADGLGFGVSGAVTRARGIRASFPGVDPTQIPMAAPVKREKLVYLLDPIGASRRSFAFRAKDRFTRSCSRISLHSQVHAQTRRHDPLTRPIQSVGERAGDRFWRCAALAGNARQRTINR